MIAEIMAEAIKYGFCKSGIFHLKFGDFQLGLNEDDFVMDKMTILYKNEAFERVETFEEVLLFMDKCENKSKN